MRYWDYGGGLVLLAASMLFGTLFAVANGIPSGSALRAELSRAALIERATSEDTSLARNEYLNRVYREFVASRGGESTAELVRQFNALLAERQLTNFDDFLAVMTRPMVYVPDPSTGERVPVFGPLGSDIINPWLAAAAVVEQRPLDKQPMYHSAIRALCEHLDFALIGLRDPNLSLELLPAELRENARSAYARLNPTNQFDGGFDHPLFYCVVREAAEKFFREDHPQARLNMAELVRPVAEGGFGIESCLLCHERDHNGVYRRLLGQGSYLSAKADELRNNPQQAAAGGEDSSHVQAEADIFLLAAERVLKDFSEQIDEAAVRQSLSMQSGSNHERLKPGYDDFVAVLDGIGCLQCHSTGAEVGEELNPAAYGVFVLDRSAYNKSANVRALAQVIDFENIDQSQLIAKASARVDHEGAARVKLDEQQVNVLKRAIAKWLGAFSEGFETGEARGAQTSPDAIGRSTKNTNGSRRQSESLPSELTTPSGLVRYTATSERLSAP